MRLHPATRTVAAIGAAAALLGVSALEAQENTDPALMSPARGYLEAHSGIEEPLPLLGGPILTSVSQEGGSAQVVIPAPRQLDEVVFGSPERPLAFGRFPMVEGLPLPMREQEDDNYTTTKEPTPFGDDHMEMSNAQLQLDATDITAVDSAASEDRIRMIASWEDGEGNTYGVRCCEMLAKVGASIPPSAASSPITCCTALPRSARPSFPRSSPMSASGARERS